MCVRVFCWCNEYPREKNVLREERFPLAHSSGGLKSMLGCLIMFRLLARQKHHCRRALGKASLFLVDRRKRRKGPQTKHALPRQSPPPIRLYFLDFLTLAMVPSNSKSISRLVQPWMESELSRSFVNAPWADGQTSLGTHASSREHFIPSTAFYTLSSSLWPNTKTPQMSSERSSR